MIDFVSGTVASLGNNSVVINVGGVGLRLSVTSNVLDDVRHAGQSVTLHTHLVVREDNWTLYGFSSTDERALFETLLNTRGVGPRLALAILSTLSPENLHHAVASDEPQMLTRVPGIGKKLAEKIVFELKDKISVDMATGLAPINDVDTDVLATLTALGYSVVEAQTAIQNIPRDAPDDIEERVRLALAYFGG